MLLTLNEWFCMKGERSSFLPELPADADLVFCHKEQIENGILIDIEKRFATKKPIKMLIFGDWGVGKTHLMYHIQWWLEAHAEDYPAFPVVIEIGDIDKKSRFDEVVRPFLDKLGLEFLIKLVHDYRGIEPNIAKGLKDKSISPAIADAFNKILLSSPGQPPVELVSQTFEFLKGRKVAGGSMGLSQPIVESQQFVDVLSAIGEMYRAVNNGKRIVFVADEAAKLDSVESDEAARAHWINANKLIFGDGNQSFGFIYTISGKQKKDLPTALADPQLENRIGLNSMFRLDVLDTPDVENYLSSLCDVFIDWGRVDDLVAKGGIPSDLYDRKSYPFTSEARARFVDFYNRTQQDSKPRNISQAIDDYAFLAMKRKERIITSAVLDLKGV